MVSLLHRATINKT